MGTVKDEQELHTLQLEAKDCDVKYLHTGSDYTIFKGSWSLCKSIVLAFPKFLGLLQYHQQGL